ncbi:MAG TPA: hypothetical protein VFP34_00295, partial [Microlunatus sp.]|nr:hypothetical protein [Microlunatus sp.]
MTEPIDWDRVSAAYGIGAVVEVPARAICGLQGQVWRLVTSHGVWAVKETLTPIERVQARTAAEFSEAARRNGVPAPANRCTAEGQPLLQQDGRSVRVQSWVELVDPTTAIDVTELGRLVARLHNTALAPPRPVHWWYT